MDILKLVKTFLLLIFVFGCSRYSQTNGEIPVYRKAIYNIPDKLEILKIVDTSQFSIVNIMYDGLFAIDQYLKITPSLVDNWKISKNGHLYTFNIKKNVKFHDGSNLKIQDVYNCLNGLRSPDSSTSEMYRKIKAIKILGNHSIQVELNSAYPPFISLLAGPNGKIYKKSSEFQYPLGTGAFRMVKIVVEGSNKVLSLKRFDSYHGNFPKIINFELWQLLEAEALELAKKGVIHDTSIYTSNSGFAKNVETLKELRAPSAATWLFSFNDQMPLTSKLNFRQCFSEAFDKKGFIERFIPDHKEAVGFLPPVLGGSKLKRRKIGSKKSCEKFRRKIVHLDMPKELSAHAEMCKFIISNMKESEIIVRCDIRAFSEMAKRIKEHKNEMSFLAQTLDNPNIEYFFNTFEKSSNFNFSNYSSAFIDNNLKKARFESSHSKRAKYFAKINQHLYDNVVTLNISHPDHISYRHRCVEGLVVNVTSRAFIDYTAVRLKDDCQFRDNFQI